MYLREIRNSANTTRHYTCTTRIPIEPMQKKLTTTIDEQVYHGLYRVVGPVKISQFIEKLIRPHVLESEIETAYAEMAQDEERETEAHLWSKRLIGDIKLDAG